MRFFWPTLIAAMMLFVPVLAAGAEDDGESAKAAGKKATPIRYASLRADEVNVRAGPGVRYHVKWVFVRKRLPVEITTEFESWRKIRDSEGAEGWVHRAMLSSERSVIVKDKTVTLRRRATHTSPAVAQLAPGMVASIDHCREQWCRVSVQSYTGWLERDGLWGVGAKETIE